MVQYYGVLTFTRGRIEGNTAENDDDGGGLWLSYLTATITDVLFKANTAGNKGGAVRLYGSTSPGAVSMTATRCTFQENLQTSNTTSFYGGGAVYAWYKATVVVRESMFFKNKAANGQGHQLMTQKDASNIPSISLINTNFVDCSTCGSNNYFNSGGTVSVETCSASPFSGTCSDRSPAEHGVTCGCGAGILVTNPGISSSCDPYWDCAATSGTFPLNTNCTLSAQVSLTGSLSVTGGT